MAHCLQCHLKLTKSVEITPKAPNQCQRTQRKFVIALFYSCNKILILTFLKENSSWGDFQADLLLPKDSTGVFIQWELPRVRCKS